MRLIYYDKVWTPVTSFDDLDNVVCTQTDSESQFTARL